MCLQNLKCLSEDEMGKEGKGKIWGANGKRMHETLCNDDCATATFAMLKCVLN